MKLPVPPPVLPMPAGEVVIAASTGLDFDALQLRIHPAASSCSLE